MTRGRDYTGIVTYIPLCSRLSRPMAQTNKDSECYHSHYLSELLLLKLFSFLSVRPDLEKRRLQRKPMSRPKAQSSNVERSADSDVLTDPDGEPEEKKDVACQSTGIEEPVEGADLQAQVHEYAVVNLGFCQKHHLTHTCSRDAAVTQTPHCW